MIDQFWTSILDTISQVIIPGWKELVALIPFATGLLFLAILGAIAYIWMRHGSANRSRVPKPLPSGRKPEDMHLPGPSLWPFVAPVGLFFMVFAVALGPLDSLLALGLLLAGVVVVTIGLLGWYLDAGAEYVAAESGSHGTEAQEMAVLPAWSLAPPEGMHLPGPSAWPLLAPVGLVFLASGLLFGPILLVAGIIMATIALIGWLLDAGRELQDVEEHGHPTQADRDPARAWPSRLMPVYFIVGLGAIVLTLLPWLLSLLPGSGA
jgi:hypothetical protein